MEDALIAVLEALGAGYPVYKQGSLSDDEPYQDASFWTFWNDNSADHAHYDNAKYGTIWSYNVFFFSTDPALPYQMISAAVTALKALGWIVSGKGSDAYSDEKTHTGRTINVTYFEV